MVRWGGTFYVLWWGLSPVVSLSLRAVHLPPCPQQVRLWLESPSWRHQKQGVGEVCRKRGLGRCAGRFFSKPHKNRRGGTITGCPLEFFSLTLVHAKPPAVHRSQVRFPDGTGPMWVSAPVRSGALPSAAVSPESGAAAWPLTSVLVWVPEELLPLQFSFLLVVGMELKWRVLSKG